MSRALSCSSTIRLRSASHKRAQLGAALLNELVQLTDALRQRSLLLSERRARETTEPLEKLLASDKTLPARLAALWTLHGSGLLEDATLDKCANDKEPAIRAWVARLTGERGDPAAAPVRDSAQASSATGSGRCAAGAAGAAGTSHSSRNAARARGATTGADDSPNGRMRLR